MTEPALPSTVGRYEILGQLGRGAMGVVLLARDPNVDRRLALKLMAPLHLPAGVEEREELRQRFLLEARAAGRLNHPGIVMVLDADTDPATGALYIAMELVEGRSLESLLAGGARLPVRRAVEMAAQVADALAYAHDREVVHRDVKTANILMGDDGRAKISDFGIAKLPALSLTLTGQVLGSPYFMSPEQVRGDAVDGRSDLFSLGSVLYRALCGSLPFAGDTIATVTFKVVNIEHRPVDEHVDLPASLVAIIDRCLAKEPADRFADGRELAAALLAVARELPEEAAAPALAPTPRTGSPPPPVAPRGRAGAAAVSRSPAAGGGTVLLAQPPPRPRSVARAPATRPAAPAPAPAKVPLPAWIAGFAVVVIAALLALDAMGPGAGPDTAAVAPAEALGPPLPVEVDAASRAPNPAEASPAPAPELAPARLEVLFESRLSAGTIALWVDGERVWIEELQGSRNPFKRMAGREVRHALAVPAGDRTLEVRVTGTMAGRAVDASRVIGGRFGEDQLRRLRVGVGPLSRDVQLSWSD